VTTFAGHDDSLSQDCFCADGTGAAAEFINPVAIATDSVGNVYAADSLNNTIRKITPAAVVTTLAGSAGLSGSADGTGAAARFDMPTSIVTDTSGNLYVADGWNSTVRQITPSGVVTTVVVRRTSAASRPAPCRDSLVGRPGSRFIRAAFTSPSTAALRSSPTCRNRDGSGVPPGCRAPRSPAAADQDCAALRRGRPHHLEPAAVYVSTESPPIASAWDFDPPLAAASLRAAFELRLRMTVSRFSQPRADSMDAPSVDLRWNYDAMSGLTFKAASRTCRRHPLLGTAAHPGSPAAA
jgi:hypothetical protein